MADANKYTILIQSKLDPKTLENIKRDIAQVGMIDLKIENFVFDAGALRAKVEEALSDIKVTFGDVRFGGDITPASTSGTRVITGTTSGTGSVLPSELNQFADVDKVVRGWGEITRRVNEATNGVLANVSATIDADSVVKSVVATYTDMEGKVRKLNYELGASGDLVLKNLQYTDNQANIYKRQADEVERLVKAQAMLGTRIASSDPTTDGTIKAQGTYDASTAMFAEYNRILQSGSLLTSRQEESLRKMVVAIKDADKELNVYNRGLVAHERTIEKQIAMTDRLATAQSNLAKTMSGSKADAPGTVEAQGVHTVGSNMLSEYTKILKEGNTLTSEQERNLKLMTETVKIADKDLKDYNRTLDSQNKFLERQLRLHEGISAEMNRRKSTDGGVLEARTAASAGIEEVNKALALNRDGIILQDEQIGKLNELGLASTNAKKAIDPLRDSTLSFSDHLKKAIEKTSTWAIAMWTFYGAVREVKKGLEFVKGFDKTLTEIGVVTGQSVSELGDMARQFNQTAKELGATTQAVAQGSLEFIRQGKTVAETNELIRVSTMQAMLANMDAAQSTEYLTSIMNGFQLEASDMMGVLDKLINLDNRFATSVGG